MTSRHVTSDHFFTSTVVSPTPPPKKKEIAVIIYRRLFIDLLDLISALLTIRSTVLHSGAIYVKCVAIRKICHNEHCFNFQSYGYICIVSQVSCFDRPQSSSTYVSVRMQYTIINCSYISHFPLVSIIVIYFPCNILFTILLQSPSNFSPQSF